MNKSRLPAVVSILIVLILSSCWGREDEKVQFVDMGGVRHVLNPGFPIKGTVILDVDKMLEIDPFQQEEVGLKNILFVKDRDGEIILYDIDNPEAHRFRGDGEYRGNLVRHGQGPGEFSPYQGFKTFFVDGQIWATSMFKIARFDKQGNLLEDRKWGKGAFHVIEVLTDSAHYLAQEIIFGEKKQERAVILVDFSGETRTIQTEFYRTAQAWDIRDPDSGAAFSSASVTPEIFYAYSPVTENVAFGLNLEYKITVKNLEGETQHVIECPIPRVHLSVEDKKRLIKWDPDSGFKKWMLSVYPDTLASFLSIKTLPHGFWGVTRLAGAEKREIDVFDRDGRYLYVLKPPEGLSLEKAGFSDSGFGIIDMNGDLPLYQEYRINNLPEIFGSRSN